MKPRRADGPFDGPSWPSALTARVTSCDGPPTIYGYRLFGDLLENYDFLHVVWLMLKGELASDGSRALFEACLGCIAAVRVSEAPSHAGLLAKTCDARPSSVVAYTAVVCSEEARAVVDAHDAWLRVTRGEARTTPAMAKARTVGPALAHLRATSVSLGLRLPWLRRTITDRAAVLGCLSAAGLDRRDQLVTAWVFGRLVGANAEALATEPRQFRSYPINLPAMHYEED
jgi:hypothetical protein